MFDPLKPDLDLDENKESKQWEENLILEESKEIKEVAETSILTDLKNSLADDEKNIIWTQIDENDIWKTEYEKSIVKDTLENSDDKKIIFDINLASLESLLDILVEKEYDFATFEPSEEAVKITFRKDKVIKDVKYIKFPIYSNILLKAKSLTSLTLDEVENEQEWTWKTRIKNNNYKVITKVVPSLLWSKLFIKTTLTNEVVEGEKSKKVPLSKILTFLWIIALITLIVWGAFIGFIVLNAKTVEDVSFFASLWINLNDINSFLWQALAFIFSILVFLETIFLVIYLFKFFLTKKEFKQKKIRYLIISITLLLFTFSTGSAWMIIDKKIRALPNWQEMSYWDVQLYDNSKLISESFTKESALLKDTTNLIGPVEIKFDLTFYAQSEERKSLPIKKYIWDFWDGETKETLTPTIIHNFDTQWNHKVKLSVEQVDLKWTIVEKEVEGIPNVNISYLVKISEKILNNWWKMVEFDATSLSELWKIEWYFMDDLDTPKYVWEYFRYWTPIFEETLVWMYIKRNDKETKELDKIFVINWESEAGLSWKIQYNRWLINDLEYEIWVDDLKNEDWKWYIEEFKWTIWDKEITKIWDVNDPAESSKINYKFDSYWEHKVKVILKDSAWETKEIEITIEIPKIIKLSKSLDIYNEDELLENVSYENKLNEYYINQIWIPTNIKLDARFIKSDSLLYTLNKVDWDYNSDWDIDESAKIWNYKVSVEWNHTITVHYEFINRKIPKDIIKMKEKIFIEWLKKNAIINFDIIKDSSYVPVTVSFDASKSQVKDEDIEKFIWDYGDGIIDEKDSIVQWHKYTVAGDYDVKLKVITTSWKEFSVTKKLILKPKPQSVKITASMIKTSVWQWIDFSSEESEWQIVSYFWDFWDGETSTEANPTHSYKKEWKYEITLKLDFANNNVLDNVINVEIVKE